MLGEEARSGIAKEVLWGRGGPLSSDCTEEVPYPSRTFCQGLAVLHPNAITQGCAARVWQYRARELVTSSPIRQDSSSAGVTHPEPEVAQRCRQGP
jgi:hypothetical protein